MAHLEFVSSEDFRFDFPTLERGHLYLYEAAFQEIEDQTDRKSHASLNLEVWLEFFPG